MKNKNMIIAGLVAIIVVILALIIFLVAKGNNDGKKTNKKDGKTKEETKYELKDEVYDDITISNIKIELLDGETLVNFTVKNNREEEYPEGMKVFSIETGNEVIEDVSSYLAAIDAGGEVDVSVVLNGTYKKIDKITIKE